MKRPRVLTAEEIRHWRETNKHTTKLPDAIDMDIDGETNVPLPSRERSGEGALNDSASLSDPLTPTLSRKGRGSKDTLSPLKQLSIREAARNFKPYGPVEATLDLHGLSKLEAYERVQHFIIDAKRRGRRHVTIITGKGRGGEVGILRANLPHWLNETALRPLISAVAEARAEKGGAGVMHVLVKHHER